MSDDWGQYDTGPFCRHWNDPSECEEVCATCGHLCKDHYSGEFDSCCKVEGCDCMEWKEK